MAQWLSIVRYSWRILWKQPLVSSLLILSLALGIGANIAVFSVVRAVLLESLPYRDPDRIFDVRKEGASSLLIGPEFVTWRDMKRACAHLAAYSARTVNLGTGADTTRVPGAEVSPEFFEALGVHPIAGRTFVRAEEAPGTQTVIVSESFVRNRSLIASAVIGMSIFVEGAPFTIVGVVPADLDFPSEGIVIWLPLALRGGLRLERIDGVMKTEIGRLPVLCRLGDATLSQALSESAMALRTVNASESRAAGFRTQFVPISDRILGPVRGFILLLQGAVGALLLLICVNASSLLLARSLDREREILIRMLLGASRHSLLLQVVADALVPALLGGVLGLGAAYWMVGVFQHFAPPEIPRMSAVVIDGRITAFALIDSIAAGTVAALIPAVRLRGRMSRDAALTGDTRASVAPGRGGRRLRQGLVALEVTLAVVFVCSAIGLGLAYWRLASAPVGFSHIHAGTARLIFPNARYSRINQRVTFVDQVLATMSKQPNLARVAIVNDLPFGPPSPSKLGFTVGTATSSGGSDLLSAQSRIISRGYFEVMGIGLEEGRAFDRSDEYPASPVAIVNRAFARTYLDGRAVDRLLAINGVEWRVVGVVSDTTRERALGGDEAAVYRTYDQLRQYDARIPASVWLSRIFIVVEEPPPAVGSVLAAQLRRLDSDLGFDDIQPMNARIAHSFARTTFAAVLMASLAAISLALAGLGVFGIFTHWVLSRTREFGLRMALGASPRRLIWLVITEGALTTLVGLIVGSAAAMETGKVLTAVVPDLAGQTVWLPLPITAIVISVMAAIACLGPASRAAAVDPAVALRTE